ncbi:U4/U6 small nuclear ribonucleoprotein Prp4-like [Schistocerca gregaria]|uniref:U4/U6 small nuclear ribonucleoprotein Prp4-like n=1 Tax=Schistocerca gregaria TaxID=7010 RepID=UPI00211EF21E|nr:U4/U6 small nuclear ribonucleoprotein Prp4-like [Schistocerca gregaria]
MEYDPSLHFTHEFSDPHSNGSASLFMESSPSHSIPIPPASDSLNIQIQPPAISSSVQVLPLSSIHLSAQETQKRLIQDLEIRRKAHLIAVPIDDEQVKARLCELHEPIILFGETKPLRRHRLRLLLAHLDLSNKSTDSVAVQPEEVREKPATSSRPFFSVGSTDLLNARMAILNSSIELARARLDRLRAREEFLKNESDHEWLDRQNELDSELFQPLSKCISSASVVAEQRPISSIRISKNGTWIITASWNKTCTLWNATTCQEILVYRGHTERLIDCAFHPLAHVSASSVSVATCSADQTIKLWSLQDSTCLGTLTGHEDRVNNVAFHPTGTYLAASSHDTTWSFWDLETQKCLLKQDGHSRPVYALSIHPDGGLISTGGTDAVTRVWDFRSGKPVYTFFGHAQPIYGMDWHPNGQFLATGAGDHTVRIWDLRMKKLFYILPAHKALVSKIRFQPKHGLFLATAGYDNVAKLWKTDDWSPIAELSDHDSKIAGIDVFSPDDSDPTGFTEHPTSPDNSMQVDDSTQTQNPPAKYAPYNPKNAKRIVIATCGFDRTFKLWTIQN